MANLLIWAEGEAKGILGGQDRLELTSRKPDLDHPPRLALWTAPPGYAELQAVLATLKPREVILFAREPETADPQGFLSRLAGLVKFALKAAEGTSIPVELARLAAATAQREATVRVGLKWLAARGYLLLEPAADGGLLLAPGGGQISGDTSVLQMEIKTLLDESAAYRRFFREASVEQLGL